MLKQGVCCVIGAGDATGSAVSRRFAQAGYTVCVARRNENALQPLVKQIDAQCDGLIDTAFAREHFAQRVADAGPDGILSPDHIAEAYWWLHQQPRDAWTFELDLRPSVER